jgi:hypothetical protein
VGSLEAANGNKMDPSTRSSITRWFPVFFPTQLNVVAPANQSLAMPSKHGWKLWEAPNVPFLIFNRQKL